MNCINCGTEITSNFCPSCGQRSGVKRITLREGWNDFWARVYGFDGMFPHTLKDLTLRPGFAAKEFIRGNRMKYYGPVGYFFLMVTLFLLVIGFTGTELKDFLQLNGAMFSPKVDRKGQQEFINAALGFASENFKIITFLSVPMEAFAARFLFFRKSGFNYLENLVLPFYLRGNMYWVSIVAFLLYVTTKNFIFYSAVPVMLLFYFGFGYTTFTGYQPKWKSFIKGMCVPLLAQLALMIIAFIVTIIVIKTNPEVYEMIRPSNNR